MRHTARRRSSSTPRGWRRRDLHLRDDEGFNLLVDVVATDYLGWGGDGVAGYYGTAAGP